MNVMDVNDEVKMEFKILVINQETHTHTPLLLCCSREEVKLNGAAVSGLVNGPKHTRALL